MEKTLSNCTEKELNETIKVQSHIDKVADVEYQAYYEKSTIKQFWDKRLFNSTKSNHGGKAP